MSAKTRSSRTVEQPAGTMLVKTVLTSAVVAAGAMSVYFLAKEQADMISATVVGVTFGISATISPVFSAMVGKSKGAARSGFILVAAGATLLDAYGLSVAWNAKEAAGPLLAYEKAMEQYQAETASARQTLETVSAKLLSREAPVWDEAVYTYGNRYEMAISAFNAETAKLEAVQANAKASLADVQKPEPPKAGAPMALVFALSLIVQGLFAIGFAAIGAHESVDRRDKTDKTPARKKRRKKTAPAKPKAVIEDWQKEAYPKLVRIDGKPA